MIYNMETEQENIHNPSCSSPPPPHDQHMPTDSRILCHEQIRTITSSAPAFPCILPQQEGTFLDLEWLRHHFIESEACRGEGSGLLLEVGLDKEDDHELVQRLGGMDDQNLGANCSTTALVVRGGNNDDQFFP